jgi:hypothetical protein
VDQCGLLLKALPTVVPSHLEHVDRVRPRRFRAQVRVRSHSLMDIMTQNTA